MVTMSNFGNNGRLGNQLFQYASLIGIAKKWDTNVVLPKWEYYEYFECQFPEGEAKGIELKEPTFNYVSHWGSLNWNQTIDINGYLQSRKYWEHCEEYVLSQLKFKDDFKKEVSENYDFSKDTIAISIRRGDYVANPNYHNLSITYFILALFSIEGWQEKNIIVFSDDIAYCRVHFGCLPNVRFSENNTAIEDLCLMSQCNHFILSNSTFSWWGAYLSEHKNKQVIRPNYLFEGRLKQINDDKDFWPEEWKIFDHAGLKIDLSDVTFTIPIHYDHDDRKKNLDLCIKLLDRSFETNIIIGEQGSNKFSYHNNNHNYRYHNFYDMPVFHRTKMLNFMANWSRSNIIFNWDADVIIAPLQIWCTVEKLRGKSDMVFPYNGQFARMPRNVWFDKIWNHDDIGMVGDTRFSGMEYSAAVSVGGAVGFKRASFIAGGMENENFISYAPEDCERELRFKRLGYKIDRVDGPLYHMNHWCGVNSNTSNPYFKQGQQEFEKVKSMTVAQLEEYIKSWTWLKD